jgi:hypothetical protein
LNSEKVIGLLRKLAINTTPSIDIASTPLSCRIVRRIHRQYKLEPTEERLELILRGHEQLATQVSIDNHIITSLQRSIKIEKKKRQRGERLNLIGEEESSRPQFFSPARIKAAREHQDKKEAEEAAEKQVKANNKVRRAREKEEKEAEKKKKAKERIQKRHEAQIEKDILAADRMEKAARRKAEIEARKALIQA